jgi:hypothetical protein
MKSSFASRDDEQQNRNAAVGRTSGAHRWFLLPRRADATAADISAIEVEPGEPLKIRVRFGGEAAEVAQIRARMTRRMIGAGIYV